MVLNSGVSKIAVLIFAQSGSIDGRRKGMPHATRLFDALTEDTISKVRNSGIPYFVHTEATQRGSTFGQRFGNSIQSAFSMGYGGLIVIGNDTPHLTTAQLLQAQKNLRQGSATLGPSQDGGFYLMGISKELFERATAHNHFLNLPWNKHGLCTSLMKLISNNGGQVRTLVNLVDIDAVEDGKTILKHSVPIADSILFLLKSLIYKLQQQFNKVLPFICCILLYFLYNKGSPRLLNIATR